MINYLNNIKANNEQNILNLFYELFFVLKYLTQTAPYLKFKNLRELIKYFELNKYELNELNNAISRLKDNLSINTILHFYEMIVNEAFGGLTKDIEAKIKNKGINIEEDIAINIDNCLKENKIIKTDIIIPAMKKYILRNIMNKDINNYLFDLNSLKQKDLWDITIFGTKEFNEEFNKLVELDKNENNVVNYLYSKIYNIEIVEEDPNPELDQDDPFN